MARDRVFDAELVIDPREALLQQGYLWSVNRVFSVPRNGGIRHLSWEVGSGSDATIVFRVLTTHAIIGDLVLVSSFSNGEVLSAINRNLTFAPTASAPLTVFRLDPVMETVTGSGEQDVLFTPNTSITFPTLIQPGPFHLAMRFTNPGMISAATVGIEAAWHEQPLHKFPAGDPGP